MLSAGQIVVFASFHGLFIHPERSRAVCFCGRVSGGDGLPNSSSRRRRSPRVTDWPRPHKQARQDRQHYLFPASSRMFNHHRFQGNASFHTKSPVFLATKFLGYPKKKATLAR